LGERRRRQLLVSAECNAGSIFTQSRTASR
jgi:hypothetical protein